MREECCVPIAICDSRVGSLSKQELNHLYRASVFKGLHQRRFLIDSAPLVHIASSHQREFDVPDASAALQLLDGVYDWTFHNVDASVRFLPHTDSFLLGFPCGHSEDDQVWMFNSDSRVVYLTLVISQGGAGKWVSTRLVCAPVMTTTFPTNGRSP